MADPKSTQTTRYADHEEHFRTHYRDAYGEGENHAYRDYEPGYRTGFRYGTSSEYAERSFGDLEPEMRRRHEKEHGEGSWDKVRKAAQHAFEHGRSPRSKASGVATSSGSTKTASGGPGSAMREGGFDAHRETYRTHHRETHEEGRDFSAHEPAYRHGHRYGSDSKYQDRSYDDLEPEMRRSYEEQHGTGAWAKVKDAVRHAFGTARPDASKESRSSKT